MPPARRTRTLPPFNNGDPLVVVRLPTDDAEQHRLGVVDAETLGVWVERELQPTRQVGARTLPRIDLPRIPTGYGKWVPKSIGGVSKTVRREGAVRATPKTSGPITLFAVQAPSEHAVADALRGSEAATVGDTMADDEHGHVAEVLVHEPSDLGHVAAVVARTGASIVLEDARVNARRSIGVERLDRIEARVTELDEEAREENDYGLHRGDDNWRFSWMPRGWRVPITWDYQVKNVAHVEDVTRIPQPLRQHVARARLAHETDESARRKLERHIPSRRLVSAGLSSAQSKQLIEAFYLLEVERIPGPPEVVHALELILYRYMMERGYTARWMGKYLQEAEHIGNGDSFRTFARMAQYDPHRLPTKVLNKLCGRDGRLHGRGSKGSRSKYIDKSKRYTPKHRVVRTLVEEERMTHMAKRV